MYSEFELLTVVTVRDGGKGYKENDIVHLSGGEATIQTYDNTRNTAALIVKKVDDTGKILELNLNSRGKYYSIPPRYCNLFDGSGDGAQVDVEFRELNERSKRTARIKNIDYHKEYSRIFIDCPLPENVNAGFLTCEKFEMFLTQNYLGETKKAAEYMVLHDFSPYLNLPLMSRNTFSPDIVFNRAALILENEIKETDEKILMLEEKIRNLEEKINKLNLT